MFWYLTSQKKRRFGLSVQIHFVRNSLIAVLFLYLTACVFWPPLMFVNVHWCLLTSVDVRWRSLMFVNVRYCSLTSVDIRWRSLMFVDVRWRPLMFVDVRRFLLTSVDVWFFFVLAFVDVLTLVDDRWCSLTSVDVCRRPLMSVDVRWCPLMSLMSAWPVWQTNNYRNRWKD